MRCLFCDRTREQVQFLVAAGEVSDQAVAICETCLDEAYRFVPTLFRRPGTFPRCSVCGRSDGWAPYRAGHGVICRDCVSRCRAMLQPGQARHGE